MATLGTLTSVLSILGAPSLALPLQAVYGGAYADLSYLKQGVRTVPVWAAATQNPVDGLATDTSGSISGVATISGTPVPRCLMRLYWRPSGQMIAQAFCNGSGAYSFSGLTASLAQYYVVGVDPDGGTIYNSLILDRIAPV